MQKRDTSTPTTPEHTAGRRYYFSNAMVFVYSSEDVRQTHDLSSKPSHPLNSGSRRPPSECFFVCGHRKNAARIRQKSLCPSAEAPPDTTPLSVLEERDMLAGVSRHRPLRSVLLCPLTLILGFPSSFAFSQIASGFVSGCSPCGNQCPWPSHGSIDGTGRGRTCGSDQPCACRRGYIEEKSS